MDEEFGGNRSHSTLWNKIQRELEAAGHNCSTSQIHNRWKNIKRKFMSVVDHNRQTGADPKSCAFFYELGQFFGTKPGVMPAVTLEFGSSDKRGEVVVSDRSEVANGGERSIADLGQVLMQPRLNMLAKEQVKGRVRGKVRRISKVWMGVTR